MREIVLPAPVQIKKYPSIDDIYSLVLCDFYAKARKLAEVDTVFPILVNINGVPIAKLLMPPRKEADVSRALNNFLNECTKFKINFDYSLRDDRNPNIHKDIRMHFQDTPISRCQNCGTFFDASIKTCKYCSGKTIRYWRNMLMQDISHEKILQDLELPNYYPSTVKKRLQDYISYLPPVYKLLVERCHSYTSYYCGIPLDSQLTSTALISQAVRIENNAYDLLTYVSGDSIVNNVYSIFTHLDVIPSDIIVHGTITDENHRKIKWQDEEDILSLLDTTEQELRTFFITHSVFKNVTVSKKTLRDNAIYMNRLKKKFLKILDSHPKSNVNYHRDIESFKNSFNSAISSWNFPQALRYVENIVNACLIILEKQQKPLSYREFNYIENLFSLYF